MNTLRKLLQKKAFSLCHQKPRYQAKESFIKSHSHLDLTKASFSLKNVDTKKSFQKCRNLVLLFVAIMGHNTL